LSKEGRVEGELPCDVDGKSVGDGKREGKERRWVGMVHFSSSGLFAIDEKILEDGEVTIQSYIVIE
jgi:hypothetical protein